MPAPVRLDEVKRGALLFKTAREGVYVPAPTITTDVDMGVAGMVARVNVAQRFFNPTSSWLEGIYVFPLPDNASVDRMRLMVGERVIEGRIAERAEAKRTYERARSAGRRAGLVEQERPNIFTTSVANIAPGEAVTVDIRYHQTLRYDQGRFRLRFPMVVGPRFIPQPATVVSADGGDGWATSAQPVPDADRITPPVLHPDEGKINPVTIRIALDAGFPLDALESSYHRIKTDDWTDGTATIELDEGAVPADRDFELVWTPAVGLAPLAGAFRETVDGETYLLVIVLPPEAGDDAAIPPRDVVYVLDRSGSMGGKSIRQARRALDLALQRLRPEDRFDMVWFNGGMGTLFGAERAATPANVDRARRFVGSIEAEGGTVMLPAIQQALRGRAKAGRMRQIVFLTDGAVGNEAQLFRAIARGLGRSRLFTVGIGSAPNTHFMRKAAEAGRGTFTHIGTIAEVEARMTDLFRKLERPVVTDLTTSWASVSEAEAFPRVLPDLYDGEPLALAVRLPGVERPAPDAALTLGGRSLMQPWQRIVPLASARLAAGISSLWARAKIAALTDTLREGADPEEVKRAVTETALRHGLVSKYTSLVAVDTTPARPPEEGLATRRAPTNLPHGWDYEKVFGNLLLKRGGGGERDGRFHPIGERRAEAAPAGPVRLASSTAPQPPAPPQAANATITPQQAAGSQVVLPQTATPAGMHVLAGTAALLTALGLVAVVFVRRRAWV